MQVLKQDELAKTDASASNPSVLAALQVTKERYLRPAHLMILCNHLAFSVSVDSVQVALYSHFLNRRRLLDVRKIYIPRDLADGDQRDQFVTGVIDDLYHRLGGRWKSVSLTVGGPETAFRRLMMPRVKPHALAQAIGFEAKRQIPFPIGDCHYDFRPVAEIVDDSGSRLKVAVIAATRRLVAEQLAPFQSLNISVEAVHLSADVIGRLLVGLPDFEPDRNYCLVNIERTCSEIAYYRGTELEFSHVISLGSQFLANRRDETVFDYFTESLANELQNSLDFYSGQNTTRFANQVYIYGDLSYSEDLINRLSNRFEFGFLRFPVESLRVFHHGGEDIQSSLSVCLPVVAAAVNGLALPNLLPVEMKAKRRKRTVDRWAIGAVAMLACFLTALWLAGYGSVSNQKAELAGLQSEIEQFRTSALYTAYDSLKQQMAFNQGYLSKVKTTPSFLSIALKELSTLTPDEVRLYDFVVVKNQPDKNGRIAGVVRTVSSPPDLLLAEFVERLRRSPVFSQVTVDGYQKKTTSGVSELYFQITMVGQV
jgi:Tfp pilus assembly PilM family ATPase